MTLNYLLPLLFLGINCCCLISEGRAEVEPGKVTSYEAKGNLEVTHELECVGFSELSNTLTPADLYGGVSKCLLKGDFDNAAQLFILAGVYATFDKLRVADVSAHQAQVVLTIKAMGVIADGEKQKLFKAMTEKLTKETPQLAENCATVRKIGPPQYHPTYMIQHGMGAFTGKKDKNGLVANFDPAAAWEKSLDTFLHCPAVSK